MQKHAYTINEACHEIGIGRTNIYQEIANGKLVARKANKRTIILAEDLTGYLTRLPKMTSTVCADSNSGHG